MLNWYFDQTENNLGLGTEPKTRAESFYRIAGWEEMGNRKNGEIHFVMTKKRWEKSDS